MNLLATCTTYIIYIFNYNILKIKIYIWRGMNDAWYFWILLIDAREKETLKIYN